MINPRGERVSASDIVSFVGMADLNTETAVARTRTATEFATVSKGYTVFRDGDLLAAKITPCWENGKIGQARLNHSIGVGSTEFHVLRPKSSLDERYLLHFLRQPGIRASGELRMTGSAGQRRVPVSFLMDLQIPLPTLPEQRRIAAILDHADALRAKRREVLAHLDSLTQSIFHEMFESRCWPTEALGDRLEFLTSGSRGWAKYYAPAGDKFIRIQNVKGGVLSELDMAYVLAPDTAEARRTAVRAGDVLLSITADLGRTAVVPTGIGPAFINQHLAILRAPSLNPRYLADFLESPAGQREVLGKDRGATKAGLNFDDIRSVSIPIPSSAVQSRYAERVEQINAQRHAHERADSSEAELFASLQSRAFKGQL